MPSVEGSENPRSLCAVSWKSNALFTSMDHPQLDNFLAIPSNLTEMFTSGLFFPSSRSSPTRLMPHALAMIDIGSCFLINLPASKRGFSLVNESRFRISSHVDGIRLPSWLILINPKIGCWNVVGMVDGMSCLFSLPSPSWISRSVFGLRNQRRRYWIRKNCLRHFDKIS